MAAFEVLGYLAIVAAASLAFLAGWLTVNGAVVLTLALLTSLIILSWINLGHGRHPAFLFLCTLMLFQGGRLIAYCFGGVSDPLAIGLMVASPFNVSRDVAGIVLLCLCISAISIYVPNRWNYRSVPPPSSDGVRRFLPYLYLVFFSSLPFLLYKNYLYLRYIQSHGGYVVFFNDYGNLAASVPAVVRAMALLPLPVLIAIFVFETRRKALFAVVALYFSSSVVLLLTGTRMGPFSLVLTLWYVARIKSTKGSRLWRLIAFAAVLIVVANLIGQARFGEDVERRSVIDPVAFIGTQGISLGVTEVAVQHRELFQPYVLSYLLHELQLEFVASDVSSYFRGRQFGYDISVLLNAPLFSQGIAASGAYLPEAYVIGGILGVTLISFVIGGSLHFMHIASGNVFKLMVVAFVFPEVLLMPRGYLLVWVSALIRAGMVAIPIVLGWCLYSLLRMTPLRSATLVTSEPGR
jgi:hypothetical protein